MVTKRDRRIAMLAKREREAEETRRSGLLAQEKDRRQRKLRAEAIAAKAKAENDRLEAILATEKMAGITHSVKD